MEPVPGQTRLTSNRVGSSLRVDLVGETYRGSGTGAGHGSIWIRARILHTVKGES